MRNAKRGSPTWIVASATEAGCDLLSKDDLQHGGAIGGVSNACHVKWNNFGSLALKGDKPKRLEETDMVRLVALMMLAASALVGTAARAAEEGADGWALQKCPAIGQTAKGELVFALECPAIKTNYPEGYKPNMPPTNLKETVIPHSGAVDTPPTTAPKAETK